MTLGEGVSHTDSEKVNAPRLALDKYLRELDPQSPKGRAFDDLIALYDAEITEDILDHSMTNRMVARQEAIRETIRVASRDTKYAQGAMSFSDNIFAVYLEEEKRLHPKLEIIRGKYRNPSLEAKRTLVEDLRIIGRSRQVAKQPKG